MHRSAVYILSYGYTLPVFFGPHFSYCPIQLPPWRAVTCKSIWEEGKINFNTVFKRKSGWSQSVLFTSYFVNKSRSWALQSRMILSWNELFLIAFHSRAELEWAHQFVNPASQSRGHSSANVLIRADLRNHNKRAAVEGRILYFLEIWIEVLLTQAVPSYITKSIDLWHTLIEKRRYLYGSYSL